jgi:ribosome-associated toxin RatA of RatAB toxin-antitoxin module
LLETLNEITIAASPDLVYRLAEDVARWPEILPHYRYVRVLEQEPDRRRVKMAAFRDFIPVSWTSIQELDPVHRRITYRHVGGITKGMDVIWQIEPDGKGTRVTISHELPGPHGLLLLPPARMVAGRFFITTIADRTLRGIKREAEGQAREAGA